MSEREKPKPCYRDRDNGVRFIKAEHRLDCAEDKCRGCKPCPERWHCTARPNCTWHVEHGNLTCGRCISGVRNNLRRIADLAALMLPAAVDSGVNSEAANLAGPSSDPRSWVERRTAMYAHLDTWTALERITEDQHVHAIEAMPEDDEHHPYAVLTRWQMMLSEDYNHDLPPRLSITGAYGYLDRTLHRVAQDDEQDFPLLRADLRKCRQHLESTIRNDDKPERGTFCPTCREGGALVRLNREYAHWCTSATCERFHFTDDGSDVWRCPRDRDHWWTQQGYADLLDARKRTA